MSDSAPIGHGLNPAQKEAVLYLDGPCLVLAGAGSGKTRVITQKIAYLLRECGYMGRNVVALTFRSEEHTSELQSLMRISYAVFCLKKKNKKRDNTQHKPSR